MTREKWTAMSADERRIKVAELCGWRWDVCGVNSTGIKLFGWRNPHGDFVGWGETKELAAGYTLPDYQRCLNAMHEAVLMIKCGILQRQYNKNLYSIHGWRPNRDEIETIADVMSNAPDSIDWRHLNSTAAQRAEAFCLTLEPEDK